MSFARDQQLNYSRFLSHNDQKSVFPTIPINEVVSQIRSNFIELNIDNIGGLLIQDFIPLLEVVLANTYFVFEGQIYK